MAGTRRGGFDAPSDSRSHDRLRTNRTALGLLTGDFRIWFRRGEPVRSGRRSGAATAVPDERSAAHPRGSRRRLGPKRGLARTRRGGFDAPSDSRRSSAMNLRDSEEARRLPDGAWTGARSQRIGEERASVLRRATCSHDRLPTNRTALRLLTGDFRIGSGEESLFVPEDGRAQRRRCPTNGQPHRTHVGLVAGSAPRRGLARTRRGGFDAPSDSRRPRRATCSHGRLPTNRTALRLLTGEQIARPTWRVRIASCTGLPRRGSIGDEPLACDADRSCA